jgi:hypothetical protein
MGAGVAQGGRVSPGLFSLYVNDITTPFRHVKYADDTALIATSGSLSLLVVCLEAHLGILELWLRDWRIAINVSEGTAVLLRPTGASGNADQCSFLDSQWSRSKQLVILG